MSSSYGTGRRACSSARSRATEGDMRTLLKELMLALYGAAIAAAALCALVAWGTVAQLVGIVFDDLPADPSGLLVVFLFCGYAVSTSWAAIHILRRACRQTRKYHGG